MDPREWIILNQLARRNCDSWQKAEYAITLEEILKDKAKKKLKTSTGGITPQPLSTLTNSDPAYLPEREWKGRKIHTREEAAKKAGISEGSIQKAKIIKALADPETIEDLEAGRTTINAAFIKTTGKTTNPQNRKGNQGITDVAGKETPQAIPSDHLGLNAR